MAEKRQLSETEKQKVLDQHERRCFVDGEPIPEGTSTQHICFGLRPWPAVHCSLRSQRRIC